MPTDKRYRIHPEIRRRARDLRKSATPAEEKMWAVLKNRGVGGFKFRRQHPIGYFIADFYCAEVNLVVEIDGSVHESQQEYDRMRTIWLEDRGYMVVRFQNDEVLSDIEQVREHLLKICVKLKDKV